MAEPIITKQCSKCKQFKPVSEFYKDNRAKDKHEGICKICCLKRQEKYDQTERGKATYKRYRQSEIGKATQKRARRQYRKQHPKKRKARNAVYYATKVGVLPQPNTLQCHYCPTQAEQYHHWHGYTKKHWLDVVSSCCLCHRQEHCNN